MRVTSITPMKDEGPFLLEWLAYHRLMGINDPIVFTNHCTDGTDMMLERLDEMGLVRHMPNPSVFTGSEHHHWQIIHYVNTSLRLPRSDWVFFHDADEFLCVNTGDGHLEDLLNAVPDADVISVNQLNFGCGWVRKFDPTLQMDQFTYCQGEESADPRVNRRGVKSLTRKGAPVARYSNHSPILEDDQKSRAKWVNGAGKEIDVSKLDGALKSISAPDFSYDLVQLNHYAVRSIECFLVQSARGNANHANAVSRLKYWDKYNQNAAFDTSIQRWSGPVRAQVDDWLSDPELGQLYGACIDFYRARIKELRADEGYHKLFMKALRRHNAVFGREAPTATSVAS